jgi:hypothetical protein
MENMYFPAWIGALLLEREVIDRKLSGKRLPRRKEEQGKNRGKLKDANHGAFCESWPTSGTFKLDIILQTTRRLSRTAKHGVRSNSGSDRRLRRGIYR